MPTASSFFTGVAGLDLAAIAAGFEVVSMSEIDPYASALLSQRFPGIPNLGDINAIKPEHIGHVDLIFGGFPCQDISVAGNGRGLVGSKSGLWFELARIISGIRPRLVILENVPAISVRGGTTVTAQLAQMGYDAIWLSLQAASVGSPQFRERWFLLAYTSSVGQPFAHTASEIHNSTIGAYSTGELVSQRNAAITTSDGLRKSKRTRHRGIRCKSNMGRTIARFPEALDRHQFPAGSWEEPVASEPNRLTSQTENRDVRNQVLGNAVVPQQALPIFRAARRFLDKQSD